MLICAKSDRKFRSTNDCVIFPVLLVLFAEMNNYEVKYITITHILFAGNGKRTSLETGDNARTNTKNVPGVPRAFLPNWLQRRTLYNVQRRLLQLLARHTR